MCILYNSRIRFRGHIDLMHKILYYLQHFVKIKTLYRFQYVFCAHSTSIFGSFWDYAGLAFIILTFIA